MDGIGGSVALVTGAGGGIGAAVAAALAEAGAVVAAADLDDVPYRVDVRDPGEVEELVGRVERELGPIGVLVSVAGVLVPGHAHETDDAAWRQTFAVNTDGVFHVCRAVARRMIPRRSGCIVTVASNAASVPRVGMAAYAASKAAARAFTQCLGLELAAHGIRCNVVSPGSTDTPMLRTLQAGDPVAGDLGTFRTGIPLGRVADPGDVADAVLFLASARSRHITMHDLLVDGGATLRA
ncbi:SDR family oxidoreductase [Nonomuraea sp. NPDC050328]|uniref:SDR family oxidoreductase n=1 Tax=Nonomuraea sp. NPDC050328 TaxID=3364361 RepID=UPI00379AFB8D